MLGTAVLAASSVNVNDITPGVLGFIVVAAMAVALVFLLKSMNKQFRKISADDGTPPGGAAPPGEGTAPPEPGAGPGTRAANARR